MLDVVCWKWRTPTGPVFGPEYVNRLRAGLARHLSLDHRLWCITDDPVGIDPDVRILPLPETYRDTPRCRRRMQIFDRAFAAAIGARLLAIDLDVVLVDDITPLVDRPEPLVCWRVGYAKVYSGSFILMNAGVLQGLWNAFRADPIRYPRRAAPRGIGSDQAMLNEYLRHQRPIPYWTEADGLVTYFGAGYEAFEHLGVGPHQPTVPVGARVIVLGSADLAVFTEKRHDWIERHWRDQVPAC